MSPHLPYLCFHVPPLSSGVVARESPVILARGLYCAYEIRFEKRFHVWQSLTKFVTHPATFPAFGKKIGALSKLFPFAVFPLESGAEMRYHCFATKNVCSIFGFNIRTRSAM